MKPTGLHMRVFGTGLAHENLPSAKPLALGFSLKGFPIFIFFQLFTFSSILFPHILDVAARV